MQSVTITLDETAVELARERFQKFGQKRKGNLSFDDYFELFSQDCQSLKDIAIATGRNKGSIYRTYKKFFAPFFPKWRTLKIRATICTRKRRILIRRSHITDRLTKLTEILTQQDLRITLIPRTGLAHLKYKEESILIQDKRCFISYVTALGQTDRRNPNSPWYTRTQIKRSSLERHDFLVVIQAIADNPWNIYLIPVNKLLEARDKKLLLILIRYYEKQVGRGIKPLLDFSQYKNAWHLLSA